MRKFAMSAALAATVLAGAVPAFAADEVFGHSAHYTAQAIAAQGYAVAGIEEWGTRIKATIVDGQGHLGIQIFDADTLRPVN